MSHSLLWTVAYQAAPSMGFSRQEYWSGLPFPSPGDLHNRGIEPRSPTLQADALPSEPPGKPLVCVIPYKLNSSKFGASRVRLPCYCRYPCPNVNHFAMMLHFSPGVSSSLLLPTKSFSLYLPGAKKQQKMKFTTTI